MPSITLKIDVDTYRGTQEGVPRLMHLLQQHEANATFLFSLGPDHTGWALKRMFRPGFFQKVARTSVLAHYGLKTLLYGVLLPAPDIGRACAKQLRAVADAGFECGLHAWDHVLWQDHVRHKDASWTNHQMQQAVQRFTDIFGTAPTTFGAAGWQMNAHAFAALDRLGLVYASDSRAALHEDGSLVEPALQPYRLTIGQQVLHCLQLPTTLPTLDELLGRSIYGKSLTLDHLAEHMLSLTSTPRDHVFTLHAELEGQRLAPIFEALLTGWRAQGYAFTSMADCAKAHPKETTEIRPLRWGTLPGRSGELVLA